MPEPRESVGATTPWALLAVDFEMATGLVLSTSKVSTPKNCSHAGAALGSLGRRMAQLCCDPSCVPVGIETGVCKELTFYGFGKSEG
eukprot:9209685-Heterocapsa_arctica.AAC.1